VTIRLSFEDFQTGPDKDSGKTGAARFRLGSKSQLKVKNW
jgi:hypothetical protein